MSDHLPECPLSDGRYIAYALRDNPPGCICDRLRACEQRVMTDTALINEIRNEQFAKGVQAARDAVAALYANAGKYAQDMIDPDDALAAIDALKEGK